MNIFDFIKTLDIPFLIVDSKTDIISFNEAFNSVFGKDFVTKKIKKFKNSFSISDCCMLDTENITGYNPINMAIEADGNCSAIMTYQKNEDEYLTFLVTSSKFSNFYAISFTNLSSDYRLQDIEAKYDYTKNELENLKRENLLYLETKDKAQNQAIKMALLNRIFEALGSSIDINTTLNLSFKELSEIFGFSKVMFAQYNESNNEFRIINVFPQKYSDEINQNIDIDKENIKKLLNNKYTVSNVANLSTEKSVAVKTECRILIPVSQTGRLIGVISAIFPRQNIERINEDMISAISAQFSSAIIQANLFKEINNKNEQLQAAYTKLEQAQLQLVNSEKMASLGQLVAGVAHEINTPIASINSNNAMFEKILQLNEFDSDIIEMLKSMIDTDKEAIKRITNIVKSLKRFVRLDEAELQIANINKEIDLTLELLKHETKNKVEIIKDYTDNDEIKCYPNLLNQVFMNLLMNAIQSIESKGVIHITTKSNDKNLLIKIKDNGSGMDDTVKAKIFKSGFTTKKVGIGTGLGLMISKDIIKKHNGEITFSSIKGEGTEFVISLPKIV